MKDQLIQNVSDTAWLVAILRAQESARKDALFKDPFAEKLVGEKGHRILEQMMGSVDVSWFMAVRTVLIDQIILHAIESHKIDTVINLACGLCSRPYRLPLPFRLKWYDIDFEDVVKYKNQTLQTETPKCALHYYPCDLRNDKSRKDLWDLIASQSDKALVITEGLLLYLEEKNVENLCKELQEHPSISLWITDLYDNINEKNSDFVNYMKESNAEFKWISKDYESFFSKFSWKIKEKRNMLEEAYKLNRAPKKTPPSDLKEGAITKFDGEKVLEQTALWLMEKSYD